jgi:hypothetical protein
MESAEEMTQRRRVLLPQVPGHATRYFQDDGCANCLDPLDRVLAGLFCGSWCTETASTIQYAPRLPGRAHRSGPTHFANHSHAARFPHGWRLRSTRAQRPHRCKGRSCASGWWTMRPLRAANQADHRDGNDNSKTPAVPRSQTENSVFRNGWNFCMLQSQAGWLRACGSVMFDTRGNVAGQHAKPQRVPVSIGAQNHASRVAIVTPTPAIYSGIGR